MLIDYERLVEERDKLLSERDTLLATCKYYLQLLNKAANILEVDTVNCQKIDKVSQELHKFKSLIVFKDQEIEALKIALKSAENTSFMYSRKLHTALIEARSLRDEIEDERNNKKQLRVLLDNMEEKFKAEQKECEALKHDINLIINNLEAPKSVWKELVIGVKRAIKAL